MPPELTAGAPPVSPLLELGGVEGWSVGAAAELEEEVSVDGAAGAAVVAVVVVGATVVAGATLVVVVVLGTDVVVVLSGGIEWSFGPALFFSDS